MGAERVAVPNVHNDLTSGWVEYLISCLQTMKPFRISVVHDVNGSNWLTLIEGKIGPITITFPIVSGSSGAGSIAFQGAVTDYTFGSPDIQARINGEMTITCSGLPVVTAGT